MTAWKIRELVTEKERARARNLDPTEYVGYFNRGQVLGAFDGRRLIGAIALVDIPIWDAFCDTNGCQLRIVEIASLLVHPQYRRLRSRGLSGIGVGRFLVEYVRSQHPIMLAGIDPASNANARPFWDSLAPDLMLKLEYSSKGYVSPALYEHLVGCEFTRQEWDEVGHNVIPHPAPVKLDQRIAWRPFTDIMMGLTQIPGVSAEFDEYDWFKPYTETFERTVLWFVREEEKVAARMLTSTREVNGQWCLEIVFPEWDERSAPACRMLLSSGIETAKRAGLPWQERIGKRAIQAAQAW